MAGPIGEQVNTEECSRQKSLTPGIVLIVAGVAMSALTLLVLHGEQQRGLDSFCWTDFGPILPGSAETPLPFGEFSWFPLGTACSYYYSQFGGYKSFDPGWGYTTFLTLGTLLAAAGILTVAVRRRAGAGTGTNRTPLPGAS